MATDDRLFNSADEVIQKLWDMGEYQGNLIATCSYLNAIVNSLDRQFFGLTEDLPKSPERQKIYKLLLLAQQHFKGYKEILSEINDVLDDLYLGLSYDVKRALQEKPKRETARTIRKGNKD